MALNSSALFRVMAVTFLGACASQQKQAAPVVRSLEISGSDQVPARKIEKKILTSDTGWWPFARKHTFDSVTWQADLARIERFYIANGFYQADVVKDEVIPRPPDGVDLKVQVSEGKPTHIGKLDVQGLDALPAADREAALEDLPLAPGAVFREADWNAAKKKLVARLRNRGYAKAEVDGRALVDVATQQANLTLMVDAGRTYTFGDIDVEGTPGGQVAPVIVWEQVRLAIREGRTLQRRGAGGGAAARVRDGRVRDRAGHGRRARPCDGAHPGRGGRARGAVPDAAPGRRCRASTQIRQRGASDQRMDEPQFSAAGMRRLTAARGGGLGIHPQHLRRRSATTWQRRRATDRIARLRLEFEQPRFFGRPSLRERSGIEFSRTLEQAYDAIGGRLLTGVVWQPLLDAVRVSVLPPAGRLPERSARQRRRRGAAGARLRNHRRTVLRLAVVRRASMSPGIGATTRSSRARAATSSLSLQQGGGPLGGDFDYLRVLPEVRGYVSFGDDDAADAGGAAAASASCGRRRATPRTARS